MRILFALTLMTILLSACPQVPTSTSPSGYQLGESIMIGMGETISIPSANLKLRLINVEESRCPKNTNCMRAGEAKVLMSVLNIDAIKEIKLEGKGMCYDETGKCGNSAKVFGKTVQLLYAYPYPADGDKGERNYQVKVVVK